MKTKFSTVIPLLSVLAIASFYIKVFVVVPVNRVSNKIYAMHTDPSLTPRQHGQLPFLYVSKFSPTRRDGGQDYALYDSGLFIVRHITQYGVQGGSGPIQDQQNIEAIKRLPSLPPGVSAAATIPQSRLLIVSLRHGTQWQTQYYDRQNIPAEMKMIADIADPANG